MSKFNSVSEVLGHSKTKEEVLQEIRSNITVYPIFLDLKKEYQEQFVQFCMGVRGVKMTYDSFFKYVFDAEKHPERLSEMLSVIIGRRLKVKRALPLEHMRISEKGSLLILDIIVEFESGELADVEIQKVGYSFPGQRACCYASDMVMRQYEREKSSRGEKFTYKDLKKVYTIVFIENSSSDFWRQPEHYVHRGRVEFDTGIELELLQEFYFIPLDIFFAIKHNESEVVIKDDLEAWLYFLGSDRPEDILKLVNSRPRFAELYQDICKFRYHPEVAIMMFSEALRKLDENTVQYMIEEQKKELELLKKEVEEQRKVAEEERKQAEEQRKQAEEQRKKAEEQKKQAEEQKKQVEEQKKQLAEKDKKIEELEKLLVEKSGK